MATLSAAPSRRAVLAGVILPAAAVATIAGSIGSVGVSLAAGRQLRQALAVEDDVTPESGVTSDSTLADPFLAALRRRQAVADQVNLGGYADEAEFDRLMDQLNAIERAIYKGKVGGPTTAEGAFCALELIVYYHLQEGGGPGGPHGDRFDLALIRSAAAFLNPGDRFLPTPGLQPEFGRAAQQARLAAEDAAG